MKRIVLLALALTFSLHARANPALHGTWSAAVDGQPLVIVFAANKQGKVNGTPMQWQTLGKMLTVQHAGGQPVAYSYELKDGKLSVAGGDLSGTVTLSKGTLAVTPAKAGAQSQAAPAKARPGLQGTAKSSSGSVVRWSLTCEDNSINPKTGT